MAATSINKASQDGLHEQTRTVLALVFSVSPLYFLVQSHGQSCDPHPYGLLILLSRS